MGADKLISGGCHCGNVRYDFYWPSSDPVIGARRCGCSFCAKHGGVWTSHRDARLVVTRIPASIHAYRFGTSTADFNICVECGVAAYVTSDIDGCRYAVINVNTFDDHGSLAMSVTDSKFDGEDTGHRLGRRSRNWIPDVEEVEIAANPAATSG